MSSLNSQSHLLSVGGLQGGNPNPPGGYISYGEQSYTSYGTYTWIAPEAAAWTNISLVMVGAAKRTGSGGGSQGGSLAYANNVPVNYNQSYTVVVGAGPGQATYESSITGPTGKFLYAGPGSSRGGPEMDGGGDGGPGGPYSGGWYCDGGGGAGGYSGNGGGGGGFNKPSGDPGSGGGGGGGGGYSCPSNGPGTGGMGGGVGLHGQGPNGSGSSSSSNGGNGSPGPTGVFGGGGAGGYQSNPPGPSSKNGMPGGVRILWGGPPSASSGTDRQFPTTNVS